jgi:hypothetical protein
MGSRITSLDEYRATKEARDEVLFLTADMHAADLVCQLVKRGDEGAVGLLSAPASNQNGDPILGWMLSATAARQLAAQLLVEVDALDGGAGGAA